MSDPTVNGLSKSPTTTHRCHGCGKPHVGELLPSGWRVHRTVRGLVFCPSCATFHVGSWR